MPITVGTASITFNDNTVQTSAPTAPTTAVVLSATAGATAGAVGTYAFLFNAAFTDYAFGSTLAGSNLYPAGVAINNWFVYTTGCVGGSTPAGMYEAAPQSGTWRCMGVNSSLSVGCSPARTVTLWLRIS